MLDRNKRIKPRPERFQNCKDLFDLILTCEERVYDQVVEGECGPAAARSPVPWPRVWEPAPESHGSVDRTEHMVALVPEERVGTGLGPAAPCPAPPRDGLGRKWSEAQSARAHRAAWALVPLHLFLRTLTSASFCPG